VEPDVPLIERKHDPLLRFFARADEIAARDDPVDEVGHRFGLGEIARRRVAAVAEIVMDREVADEIVGVVENLALPLSERRHSGVGGAADDEFDRGVGPLHHLGGFERGAPVLVGGAVAGLPRAVHLVAETPDFDAVWLFGAVSAALVGECGSAGEVAVFDELLRLGRAAGAEVHGHHRGGVGFATPFHEFVGSEEVRFERFPREVEPGGALFARADAVFPVVPRDEVAAGIARERHIEFADELDHIPAEAVLIGGGVSGLVDSLVDGAAEVLHKTAVNAVVDLVHEIVAIHDHTAFHADAPCVEGGGGTDGYQRK